MKIDKNEFQSFYKENFSKDKLETFFYDVASSFIKKCFVEEQIDNHQYEKDAIKLILKIIISELEEEFYTDKKFIDGFSGFLLKKDISLMFKFITELILKEVAYSNKNAIEFLKYYSQDIIVYDGKRYKVPTLQGKDGLRWTITSLMGIVKTYVKTKDYITEIEINKDELDKKIISLYVDGVSPVKHNKSLAKEFKALDKKIEKNAKKIEILHESLEILKSENDVISINNELEEFEKQRLELKDERKLLIKRRINQSIIFRYEELIRELENIQRKTKAQYLILEQNEKSFQSIKSALTKAILSKKQLI